MGDFDWKDVFTAVILWGSWYLGIVFLLGTIMYGIHTYVALAGMLVLPVLLIPQIWTQKRKKALTYGLMFTAVYMIIFAVNYSVIK